MLPAKRKDLSGLGETGFPPQRIALQFSMDDETREKLGRMLGTAALSNSLVELYDRFEARRRAGRSVRRPDENELALLTLIAEMMGQPLKEPEQPTPVTRRPTGRRNQSVSVRLSKVELDHIKQAANAAGCSLSDFVVGRCLPADFRDQSAADGSV
jgi:predicted DNA binding CopG/RHH family protein